MINYLIYLMVFVLGAIVGSFLNCVIYRLERGRKSLGGRSFCPHCEHQLGFWDLIPVVSFIALAGKCRYCQKNISLQYPIVELFTGFLFLISYFLFSIHFLFLISYLIIGCLLVVIFVYDLKHYIIPDKIIYPAIGLALFYRIIFNFQFSISKQFSISQFFNFQTNAFLVSLLSGVIAAAFFFSIWAISRGKWLGFGDVKLAFFMGLFLGWPNILVGLFAGFCFGGIIGIILILLGRKRLKSQVPFGPFLVAGTFVALFWGEKIVNWYLSLL